MRRKPLPAPDPVYAAIAAIVDRKAGSGLLEIFRTDLEVHDRRWIEAHPGQPFVWFANCHGTYLVRIDAPERLPEQCAGRCIGSEGTIRDIRMVEKHTFESYLETAAIAVYDGTSVRELCQRELHSMCDGWLDAVSV